MWGRWYSDNKKILQQLQNKEIKWVITVGGRDGFRRSLK